MLATVEMNYGEAVEEEEEEVAVGERKARILLPGVEWRLWYCA